MRGYKNADKRRSHNSRGGMTTLWESFPNQGDLSAVAELPVGAAHKISAHYKRRTMTTQGRLFGQEQPPAGQRPAKNEGGKPRDFRAHVEALIRFYAERRPKPAFRRRAQGAARGREIADQMLRPAEQQKPVLNAPSPRTGTAGADNGMEGVS